MSQITEPQNLHFDSPPGWVILHFFGLLIFFVIFWGVFLAGLWSGFGGWAWTALLENPPQGLVIAYLIGLYLVICLNLVYFQKRGGLDWPAVGFIAPTGQALLQGGFIGANLIFMQYTLCFGLGLLQRHVFFWPENGAWILFSCLPMALAFALVEEWLFRGWILTVLHRVYPLHRALALQALLFAAVHFLRPWENRTVLIAFVGLGFAGYFLGLVRFFTGNLWYSIGLHAGWIYTVSVASQGQIFGSPQQKLWLSGGYNPSSGVIGMGILGLMTLIFALSLKPKNQNSIGVAPDPNADTLQE